MERPVQRIEWNKRVERRSGATHEGTDGRAIAAETAGKRRTNLGIGQIDFRAVDRSAVHGNRCFALAERAGALVVIVPGEKTSFDQFVATIEVRPRITQGGDVTLRLRLCLIERGPVIAVIDLVEKIALLHISAVRSRLRLDVPGNLGLE